MSEEKPRESFSQQAPPQSVQELNGFPQRKIKQGLRWYKVHQRNQHPWYFNNQTGARFNLTGEHGTCYMANKPEAAIRELIGPSFMRNRQVPPTLLKNRVVSRLYIPYDVSAARLTDDTCFMFGVNNELATSTSYEIARAWAAKFFEAGFTGIWYRPRFSPGESRALAVFDTAGVHEGYEFDVSKQADSFLEEMGITVIDTGYEGFQIIE